MSTARKLVQVLLVVLALAAGGAAFAYLRSTKPEATREERSDLALLVEVATVHAARHVVEVYAHGSVVPAQRVVVQPELSGRVIAQNPTLIPGGRVKKGDLLLRIDPRDYALALASRRADVSRAELEVQVEKSRQQVAEREWKMFGELGSATPDAGTPSGEGELALRGPQLRTAQVAVQSATSALERAQLDLTRTVVKAPFNALVIEERVDLGQLVTPQTQLATLVGTDAFWVQISVPVEALAHVSIPGVAGSQSGARARIYQQVGSVRVERTGRILRLLPDLDQGGAMARLLLEIQDPLGLAEESGGGATVPLLLNAYVDASLEARDIERAIEVPRAALRDDSRVYVVDGEDRLRIREVTVAWRKPASVLVSAGLEDGEQLVTSRVAAAIDGMKVRKAQLPQPETSLGAPGTGEQTTSHRQELP